MVVTTVGASVTENYHLPEDQLWVVYLGQLVGILVGTALSATLQPASERLLQSRSSGKPVEEHRLALLAMLSLLWPVGFLGYGWSIERQLPVAVHIVFTGVLGIVRVIILVSFSSKFGPKPLISFHHCFRPSLASTVARSIFSSNSPSQSSRTSSRSLLR